MRETEYQCMEGTESSILCRKMDMVKTHMYFFSLHIWSLATLEIAKTMMMEVQWLSFFRESLGYARL